MSTPIEKYIEIEPLEHKGLTRIWAVRNVRTRASVGWIKWYGGWRKYVFFPEADCFFDWACLAFIGTFIETQTKLHLYGKKRMAK